MKRITVLTMILVACILAFGGCDDGDDSRLPADFDTDSGYSTDSTTEASTDPTTDSGSDTEPGCDIAPANPNTTWQARRLLCYLYSIFGTSVLSGQQETSWDNPEGDIQFYLTHTGKAPAILGGDYLYPDGTSQRAIAYSDEGGIVMLRYHMGNPPNADTYENSLATSDLDAVLTPGTAENTSFMNKLNYAAGELRKLQNAGVAVLWAPFHEAQPSGWFWWSKGTPEQYRQLWITMFNSYTHDEGLNNLIWLMPFSKAPNAGFYPGDEYVDIAGPDTYDSNQPFASLFSATREIVGDSRPIPLHETAVIPNPDEMFASAAAPWVLFSIWAGYQESDNTVESIQQAYGSPWLITRDELPPLN